MLGILRKRKKQPELTNDPRTLLKTTINYAIENKCGCQYYNLVFYSKLEYFRISTNGGENLKAIHCASFVCIYMINSELAKTINWLGIGAKTTFSTLKLFDVLKGMLSRLAPEVSQLGHFCGTPLPFTTTTPC